MTLNFHFEKCKIWNIEIKQSISNRSNLKTQMTKIIIYNKITYRNETKCTRNDNNFANQFRDDMMIFVVFIFSIFSLSLRNSNFRRYVFRFKTFQIKFHFIKLFVSFNSNFNFKNISISQNYKILRSTKILWTNYQIFYFRNHFFIRFDFIIRLKNTLRRVLKQISLNNNKMNKVVELLLFRKQNANMKILSRFCESANSFWSRYFDFSSMWKFNKLE